MGLHVDFANSLHACWESACFNQSHQSHLSIDLLQAVSAGSMTCDAFASKQTLNSRTRASLWPSHHTFLLPLNSSHINTPSEPCGLRLNQRFGLPCDLHALCEDCLGQLRLLQGDRNRGSSDCCWTCHHARHPLANGHPQPQPWLQHCALKYPSPTTLKQCQSHPRTFASSAAVRVSPRPVPSTLPDVGCGFPWVGKASTSFSASTAT